MVKFFSKKLLIFLCAGMILSGCSYRTAKVSALVKEEQYADILVDEQGSLVIKALRGLESVAQALQKLEADELIELEYDMIPKGMYVTSINGISQNREDGMYWHFYTDLFEKYGREYASTEEGSYSYGNEQLGYANFGLSGMPFIEGKLYALIYEPSAQTAERKDINHETK